MQSTGNSNAPRADLTEFDTLPAWRKLLTVAAFPTVFMASMIGAGTMMQQGANPEIPVAVFTVITALIIMVLERVNPHAESWNRSRQDVPTDIAHVLLSEVAPPELWNSLFRNVLLVAAAGIAANTGLSLWPAGAHWAIQLCLAMVVSEFGQYWWHRFAHEHDLGWRFHSVHHSPERLYWLNAGRFHPLDTIFSYTLQVTPLILLGCGAEIIALFTLWTAVHGMFQHSNIELRLGPLNWIFSMAELHRWHHSLDTRDQNANYGANIIFWDIVFGTRHHPRDREHQPDDVGFLGMPGFPNRYWGQLAVPFVWRKLKRSD